MTEDLADAALPAGYVARIHRAEVLETQCPGPGMIRVRFGGPDLRDYPTTGIGDEYVRMFFPSRPGTEVSLPHITSLRGWEYPDDVEPAPMRVYTIRAHAPGEVLVDFVVHEGGVAAAWAQRAQPGQAVGINPPCGIYGRPETLTRQILVADEPGMPAALRLAELTADTVRTLLLLEVRSTAHRLLADTDDVEYRWLDGTGNGHGASGVLDALRELAPGDDTYVWVSTEGRTNRAVRRYLRREVGLPADHYTCGAYWQENRDPEEIDAAVENLYEDVGL